MYMYMFLRVSYRHWIGGGRLAVGDRAYVYVSFGKRLRTATAPAPWCTVVRQVHR